MTHRDLRRILLIAPVGSDRERLHGILSDKLTALGFPSNHTFIDHDTPNGIKIEAYGASS